MHSTKKDAAILVGCCVLALVLAIPVVVHGDDWNWETRFTVNQAAEVPGLILQPNTRYVIQRFDSPAERHVVQIYNDDKSRMLTMFMCAEDRRMEPADKTVFTFIETAPGYPMPIKEWFYPGALNGLEFIYSNKQAKEIAQHAVEPVLTAKAGDLHNLASVTVEAGHLHNGQAAELTAAVNFPKTDNTAPVVEEKPTAPEPVPPLTQNTTESNLNTNDQQQPDVQRQDLAEPETTAPAQNNSTENNVTEPQELPRTAGELPLIALIGALCLGAGFGLRVLKSRP